MTAPDKAAAPLGGGRGQSGKRKNVGEPERSNCSDQWFSRWGLVLNKGGPCESFRGIIHQNEKLFNITMISEGNKL